MSNFKFISTPLPGVIIIETRRFDDARGFFMESFAARDYTAAGIETAFVQDNHSCSRHGVLRGLHFQRRTPQGKLVRVVTGSVLDVAVDIRPGSATFGRWTSVELSATNGRQLYIPAGFAHGFLALEEQTQLMYKCTQYYDGASDAGIAFDDPTIAIDWGLERVGLTASRLIISDKDRALPKLLDLGPADLV